jgi:hypothetical protein
MDLFREKLFRTILYYSVLFPTLREFSLTSRHLGPRCVWNGGSEPRPVPHFGWLRLAAVACRWLPSTNSQIVFFGIPSTMLEHYFGNRAALLSQNVKK